MESVIFKIFIFVVFGITDLVIVLISGFAYGKKNRYQEGMLFGVHIPEEMCIRDSLSSILLRSTGS